MSAVAITPNYSPSFCEQHRTLCLVPSIERPDGDQHGEPLNQNALSKLHTTGSERHVLLQCRQRGYAPRKARSDCRARINFGALRTLAVLQHATVSATEPTAWSAYSRLRAVKVHIYNVSAFAGYMQERRSRTNRTSCRDILPMSSRFVPLHARSCKMYCPRSSCRHCFVSESRTTLLLADLRYNLVK